MNREKLQLEQAHGKAQESFEELNAELESWNNKQDPEPEQPECVRQNRRRLKEQGIPYQQFYKIIEFDTGLTREQADRIEEALMNMGVLDALIISEEYREQVYSLDQASVTNIFSVTFPM